MSRLHWSKEHQAGIGYKMYYSDRFGDILSSKENFGNYLKEKCLSGPNTQLSFKYFSNSCLILKLFSKVSYIQTKTYKSQFETRTAA